MTYTVYIVKKEGQAEVSEYVGRTDDVVEASSACILISTALENLDATDVTEVRAVNEHFECVRRDEIRREEK